MFYFPTWSLFITFIWIGLLLGGMFMGDKEPDWYSKFVPIVGALIVCIAMIIEGIRVFRGENVKNENDR